MSITIPTALPRLTPRDLIVDNSKLSAMACSTHGAMRYVLHLTTKDAASELVCGSALHEGWARWLVTGDPAEALAHFDTVYRPWAREHVPTLDASGKAHPRTWKNAHRIFERWLKDHPLPKWRFVVDPQHVEIPVWAPLGGYDAANAKLLSDPTLREINFLASPKSRPPVVMFTALLDAIGKNKVAGGFWSIDHKSTGSLGDWYKDRQEDASQFTGQLWAAKQRDLPIPLKGVFINGLELRALNSSDKRCRVHGVPYLTCALEPEHHKPGLLFPVTRSPREIAAWEQTAILLTRKYIRLLGRVETIADIQDLPMEGRFAGLCSRCDFRDFCRLGRTKQAASGFKVEEWNPLDHAFTRGGLRDVASSTKAVA